MGYDLPSSIRHRISFEMIILYIKITKKASEKNINNFKTWHLKLMYLLHCILSINLHEINHTKDIICKEENS